ncbi:phospholipase D-like domain-containing protein [Aquiflexum lacus]|uniref:hypothetical protein n=1 Tax=Aquiflexum lacus TaxID=2483805 RepID=UPI0018955AFA|nr:hypothetical protein [Aquiflexum lacus]
MGKFITGKELEEVITDIIYKAKKTLMIVSPFIKLDDYFKEMFNKHEKNPDLHIILIFGKNEGLYSKSLSREDFDFFKKFPKISIVYVKNLHAKYYGNEKMGVTTSVNLYDFSFKNNIEYGIYKETQFSYTFNGSFDSDVFNFSWDLTENHPCVFVRRPIIQKSLMGLKTKYLGAETLLDQSHEFIRNKFDISPRLNKFPDVLKENDDLKFKGKPSREEIEINYNNQKKEYNNPDKEKASLNFSASKSKYHQEDIHVGYCIRTGEQIDFNPERPFSYQAFKSWNYFGNADFPEKFCHFSGEASNGETSAAKPILGKNWRQAKSFMDF